MLDAKAKCSQCGAELTNLTFSWGKRQWLWSLLCFIPIMLLMFRPGWMLLRNKHDYTTEIQSTIVETRVAKGRIDVVGKIKNVGTHVWTRIQVEAELYDDEGQFLDEISSYIPTSLSPNREENFRLTLSNTNELPVEGTPKIVLKVASADEDWF